jgi:hypothetical protein
MSRSTDSLRLATEADIVAAVLWRTAGLDRSKLPRLVTKAGKLPGDLRADHPAVVEFLRELAATFPDDQQSTWTLLCAIAAVASREDRGCVFWGAGICVVESHRKSSQRPEKAPCDALSSLCKDFHANRPNATPSEAFDHFVSLADLGGEVIADHNPERDSLIFYPNTDSEPKEISRSSFCRRYRRIVEASRADMADIGIANVRRAA